LENSFIYNYDMPMKSGLKKYIPESKFLLKSFIGIAIFSMLQSLLLSLNGVIDSFMVGNIYSAGDTIKISGVTVMLDAELAKMANSANTEALSYVNWWWFCVSNVAAFVSGALAFFTAMYMGKKDIVNVRKTFVLRVYMSLLIVLVFSIFLYIFSKESVNIFARKTFTFGEPPDNEERVAVLSNKKIAEAIHSEFAIEQAINYLRVIIFSWIIWVFNFNLSNYLKEDGNTKLPMFSILASTVSNICLNLFFVWVLKTGVVGTAYATIIARFINVAVLTLYIIFKRRDLLPRPMDLYSGLFVKLKLFLTRISYVVFGISWTVFIILRPVFWNSYFNSPVDTTIVASSGAVLAISGTIQNIFLTAYDGITPVIYKYVGYEIGRGNSKNALKYANQILGFGAISSLVMSVLLLTVSFTVPYMTGIFDVPNIVLTESKYAMIIVALVYPFWTVMGSIRLMMSQGSASGKVAIMDGLTTGLQSFLPLLLGYLHMKYGSFPNFWMAYAVFFSTDYLKCFVFLTVFKKVNWNVVRSKEFNTIDMV
jgi:Na+-driven multidrug efflux pump